MYLVVIVVICIAGHVDSGQEAWHLFLRNSDCKDHKNIVDGHMEYVLYSVWSGCTLYLLTSFGSGGMTDNSQLN